MTTILDQLKNDIYDFSDLITKISIVKTCKYLMDGHGYEYDMFKNIAVMKRKYLFKACELAQLDLIWSLYVGPFSHYAVKIAKAWFPKMVSNHLREGLAPFAGHTCGTPGPVFIKQKYLDVSNYILNLYTYFRINYDVSMCEDEKLRDYTLEYLVDLCKVSVGVLSPALKRDYTFSSDYESTDERTYQIWPQVHELILGGAARMTKYFLRRLVKHASLDLAFSLCMNDHVQIYNFICRGATHANAYSNINGIDVLFMMFYIKYKYIGFDKTFLVNSFPLCYEQDPEGFHKLFEKWTTAEVIKNVKNEIYVKYICANRRSIRKDYISRLTDDECRELFFAANTVNTAMKLINAGRIPVPLIRLRYEARPKERGFWAEYLDETTYPSATRAHRVQTSRKWFPDRLNIQHITLSERQCRAQREICLRRKFGKKKVSRKGRLDIHDYE